MGLNHMLTEVMASVRADVMSKIKLPIPEENCSGDKTESLGYLSL